MGNDVVRPDARGYREGGFGERRGERNEASLRASSASVCHRVGRVVIGAAVPVTGLPDTDTRSVANGLGFPVEHGNAFFLWGLADSFSIRVNMKSIA